MGLCVHILLNVVILSDNYYEHLVNVIIKQMMIQKKSVLLTEIEPLKPTSSFQRETKSSYLK